MSRSISGAPGQLLVKATNSIAEFPFMVSSDEVDLSLDASSGFSLVPSFWTAPSDHVSTGLVAVLGRLLNSRQTNTPFCRGVDTHARSMAKTCLISRARSAPAPRRGRRSSVLPSTAAETMPARLNTSAM